MKSLPPKETYDENVHIWGRIREGQPDALRDLYVSNYIPLMNYGIKLSGSRDLARDAVVQVLLYLWDRCYQLPEVQNVRSYLITCIHREILDQLEKNKKRRMHDHLFQYEIFETEHSYEDLLIQQEVDEELNQELVNALLTLTERERQLIRLRFFDGLSYDEIADVCNITRRTAYNIICHSLVKLRQAMIRKKSAPLLNAQRLSLLIVSVLHLIPPSGR